MIRYYRIKYSDVVNMRLKLVFCIYLCWFSVWNWKMVDLMTWLLVLNIYMCIHLDNTMYNYFQLHFLIMLHMLTYARTYICIRTWIKKFDELTMTVLKLESRVFLVLILLKVSCCIMCDTRSVASVECNKTLGFLIMHLNASENLFSWFNNQFLFQIYWRFIATVMCLQKEQAVVGPSAVAL